MSAQFGRASPPGHCGCSWFGQVVLPRQWHWGRLAPGRPSFQGWPRIQLVPPTAVRSVGAPRTPRRRQRWGTAGCAQHQTCTRECAHMHTHVSDTWQLRPRGGLGGGGPLPPPRVGRHRGCFHRAEACVGAGAGPRQGWVSGVPGAREGWRVVVQVQAAWPSAQGLLAAGLRVTGRCFGF